MLVLLASCTLPGNAAPVVKIGLIAPFEGSGRSLGYAVLPVVKAAVADTNAGGSLGPYRIALVAFNDNLDARTAGEQAQALAVDGDVLAVLGPFTTETAAAAAAVLEPAGIPLLPVTGAGPGVEGHAAEIDGAKAAAGALLQALAADIALDGRPSRDGLTAALVVP